LQPPSDARQHFCAATTPGTSIHAPSQGMCPERRMDTGFQASGMAKKRFDGQVC